MRGSPAPRDESVVWQMAGEGRRRDRRANGDAAGDAPLPAPLPTDYPALLAQLKAQIRGRRWARRWRSTANSILLYWRIGEVIVAQQEGATWGEAVLDRLSADLRRTFPGVSGLSRRNLYRMRAFYRAYRDRPEFVPQVVAQLPWGHNIALLEKLQDPATREWYARATIAHGWSRAILEAQIETRLDRRQGRATTNFARALPGAAVGAGPAGAQGPVHLRLPHPRAGGARAGPRARDSWPTCAPSCSSSGSGSPSSGSQYHLEVGGEDFYVDLLFYHVRLRCYVVIDLKLTAFKPEYAGKINFYLSAVDDLLRHPDDRPTIGILLCRGQNRVLVEYALRDIAKPLGVAGFTLAPALPARLAASLPTPEQLAAELDGTAASAPEEQGDDT